MTAATLTLTVAATALAERDDTWFGDYVFSQAVLASWPEHPDRYDIFAVDGAGVIWQIRATAAPLRYEDWVELKGLSVTGKPAVVTWDDGQIDLFARGRDDNALWHSLFNGKKWLPWESLEGVLDGDPVAVRREQVDASLKRTGTGYVDVFIRGNNNLLYLKEYGGQWTGFQEIGDNIVGTPSVLAWGNGRVDIVARSTDDALVHASLDPAVAPDEWTKFEVIPGSNGLQTYDPDTAADVSDRLNVFSVQKDGALWQRTLRDGKWSAISAGGALSSAPTVVSWAGRLDAFARGSDGTLQHAYATTGWSKWSTRAGSVGQRPSAIALEDKRVEIIIVDKDFDIHRKTYNGR